MSIILVFFFFSLVFFLLLFLSSLDRCCTLWSTLALTPPPPEIDIKPTPASFPIVFFPFTHLVPHSLHPASFFSFGRSFQNAQKIAGSKPPPSASLGMKDTAIPRVQSRVHLVIIPGAEAPGILCVSDFSLAVVERERRLWRRSISSWNREWSCIITTSSFGWRVAFWAWLSDSVTRYSSAWVLKG